MCQAIPRRILELDAGRVRVDTDGEPRWVKLADHLAGIAVGDYVVVYAGIAVSAVPAEEAAEQLAFLRELDALLAEEPR